MTKYNDDAPGNTIERSHRVDANTSGNGARREPSFSNFDDIHEDGYEEPDRDSDFASGYRADSVEDEEAYDDDFADEEERDSFLEDSPDASYGSAEALADDDDDSWLDEDEQDGEDRHGWPLSLIAVAVVALALLAAGGYGVMQQRAATQEELRELRAALAVAGDPGDAGSTRGALEALQQSYDKLAADSQALTLENRRLADTVAGLEAQLGAQQSMPTKPDTVQGKPVSGSAGQEPSPAAVTPKPEPQAAIAPTKPSASEPAAPLPATPQPATPQPVAAQPATPKPVATQAATAPDVAPKPATVPAAAGASSGPWFVNFGTYASRAMAETWASRLHPNAGEVIIAPSAKDGRTLFRLRVVGLADRASAQQVARNLEAELQVSELWVGKE